MRIFVWIQSCAIVALALYAFYVRRKSVRPDSKEEEAVSSPEIDEKEPAEASPLPADKVDTTTDSLPKSLPSGGENLSDRELFERIHRLIVDDKLFLDPDFSREHVIKLGLMNKNKVAQMFRQFAHTNFNGYVNALRLEYALALMHKQPGMPIKAVAYDAGFNSIRTFYRAFERVYGKTPVEYKASFSYSIQEKEK